MPHPTVMRRGRFRYLWSIKGEHNAEASYYRF